MTPRTAAESTVPEDGIAKLTRLIEGWTDKEGKRHKGALEAIEDLQEELAELKEERQRLDALRLDWKKGLTLAAAGGLLGQIFAWLRDHIR